MQINQRIKAISTIGKRLQSFYQTKDSDDSQNEFNEKLRNVIRLAEVHNPWFTPKNINFGLKHWSEILTEKNLSDWIKDFTPKESKNVGLILAGNLPLVGLHDILSVIISGNTAQCKLSSKDEVLNKWFFEELYGIDSAFKDIVFESERLKDFDAIIATGSNNTARYFESYFKNVPSIIRKNRTSIAILEGTESEKDLALLAEDYFLYFGLGCRNISKVYVPESFDLGDFYKGFEAFKGLVNHNKYVNNYEYHKAIYLMNQDDFLDFEYFLVKEDKNLFAPTASLYVERYSNKEELSNSVKAIEPDLQCIIGNDSLCQQSFGDAQRPSLTDYADGIDTLEFLNSI